MVIHFLPQGGEESLLRVGPCRMSSLAQEKNDLGGGTQVYKAVEA